VNYKDTINRFSIDIPAGWTYGINKSYPELILLALSNSGTPRDNFNINTINTPTKTLDKSFSDFVRYLPDAKDYKLIDTGSTTLNGTNFKWLIESHNTGTTNLQLHNYDFLTLKNGKTYILTMVTSSNTFEAVKPLFDKIAGSFVLFD